MKQNYVIGLMTIVWLLLISNIIWMSAVDNWEKGDEKKLACLEVAKYANQIVVVSVQEDEATLCLFERVSESEKWELILETEAVIGKNGLGKTKEGDGKTPIGVFRFIHAFGIKEDPGAKLDYIQVNENHYWVDDGASNYYNQFVSTEDVLPDWKSAEQICKYDETYHYVLATSYNDQKIPGFGSAVFLHCMSQTKDATAGCIAVPEVYMREIIKRVEIDCVLIIDKAENILKY